MKLERPNYAWYAIYTKPNREKRIIENLKEDGIECFLPTTTKLKQWNDGKEWIEEPLFRSCIFVRVSYIEFFNVLNSQGVVCFMSFGGKPQIIPDNKIENIRRFVKHNEKEIVFTRKHIDKGLNAQLVIGPLRGVQGELVQMNSEYLFIVRVEYMNTCMYTKISLDEIKLLNHNNSTLKSEQWGINRFTRRRKEFETIDSTLF